MSIKTKILGWLVPSTLVEWLNGKKSILGIISLALWAVIYGLPVFCATATCGYIATLGLEVQAFLMGIGLNLDTLLTELGISLTVIGLADKIINHWLSNVVTKGLKAVEGLGKAPKK